MMTKLIIFLLIAVIVYSGLIVGDAVAEAGKRKRIKRTGKYKKVDDE